MIQMDDTINLNIQGYPPSEIIFYDIKTNKEIGKLFLESPMRFEGDVERSAKMFFDEFVKLGHTIHK